MSGIRFNPFTGTLDLLGTSATPSGPVSATQAPKLIVDFDTDTDTLVRDMVRVSDTNLVTRIASNLSTEIPNGVFGIVVAKPFDLTASVLFVGVVEGFTGLTPGAPIFIGTDGKTTQTVPTTGMVQQVGFAIATDKMFFNLMQAVRRG